jgi:hypothetical protein
LFIVACQNNLTVIESIPKANAIDVESNAIIRVSFSTPLDKSSINKEQIYLTKIVESTDQPDIKQEEKKAEDSNKTNGEEKKDESSVKGVMDEKIFGSIRFEGATPEHPTKIAFYSSKLLDSGTKYRFTISSIKNEKGNKMAVDYTLDFITKSVIYQTPKVKSATLAPESTESFKQDTPIIVNFDAPISPEKVKNALIVWKEENEVAELSEGTSTETKQSYKVQLEVYLIENSKGDRFTKYIYFPSDGRFIEGKHTASIWIDRKSLIAPLEFKIVSGYYKKNVPDNYISGDEFLPDVDPFNN